MLWALVLRSARANAARCAPRPRGVCLSTMAEMLETTTHLNPLERVDATKLKRTVRSGAWLASQSLLLDSLQFASWIITKLPPQR